MSETLVWWVMVQLVALAALPLCLALFRHLPDRGYTLSKPFGLLLTGYIFWILVVIGFPNATRGIWFVLVFLFAVSGYFLWRQRDELLSFVRERWWLIAAAEALFFLAFITAAYLRSFVPELGGTEKPMDFMFLNAVTHGDTFPPEDPWLAGESVSYYYFGYLLVSLVTRISGLETAIGFNLGLAMIVALAATGIFGLVFNLAAPREERATEADPGTPARGFASRILWRPMAFGVVGALLLTVMANLEGLLEFFAAHDFGSSGFWRWVDVRGLTAYDSGRWYPDQFWFWWKATRILDGGNGIHEFPFFSFQLGDLHPHVMSIPFVLLAVGVAMAFLRSDEPLDLVVWLEHPLSLIGFGLILGGLAFLNTWDMPTMAFVATLVVVLRNRLHAGRWSRDLALDSAGFLIPLFLVAFVAYTPFFFGGFDSQAAGFTAEAGAGSGLFHTFLLWGPFAILVLPYAAWRLSQHREGLTAMAALWALAPALAILFLWAAWDVLAAIFEWLPATLRLNEAGFERGSINADLISRIGERGWNWLTVIVMGGALSLLGLALVREVEGAKRAAEERLGHILALALAATAALLILGTEFIYIEDGFSSRLNTIFKLYYQSWLLLSIAGAFALYELSRGWRLPSRTRPAAIGPRWSIEEAAVVIATTSGAIVGVVLGTDAPTRVLGGIVGGGILFATSGTLAMLLRSLLSHSGSGPSGPSALSWRAVWAGAVAVILIAAFVYPVITSYKRTGDFDLPRTLNGLERIPSDERAAIEWLNDRDGRPVVAEALGDDYSDGGRVSASTGLPTLLQWPGHELQWRGDADPQLGRAEDLELLYTSTDSSTVRSVIEKYGVTYVVLGPRERSRYANVALEQMTDVFETAFQQGEIAIFRVRPFTGPEVRRD